MHGPSQGRAGPGRVRRRPQAHCVLQYFRSNLHSGVDGGATVEPTNELCKLLGTMTDASGRVAVPG